MPSRRVVADLNSGTYYLTMTIQRWYYLFDRHNRWQILADSLRYCQEHKGLELNGYVFMLNHIHLIATCPDVSGFLRDFKRFTSVQFKCNLEATEPSVLKLFVDDDGNTGSGWKPTPQRKSKIRSFICKSLITSTRTQLEKVMWHTRSTGLVVGKPRVAVTDKDTVW